jgi:hypothetical protein
MNNLEEKIAEIITGNDVSTAASTIVEILRNLAKNDPVIADYPDHSISIEIDSVCEDRFG